MAVFFISDLHIGHLNAIKSDKLEKAKHLEDLNNDYDIDMN